MSAGAMLVIFAGVGPADAADFNLWYDREHLADRVDVPGFRTARRYAAEGVARWPWLAIYDVDDLAVFATDAYKAKLAGQSDWSKKVFPTFVDPQRSVARVVGASGAGMGGHVAVWRLRGSATALASSFARVADATRQSDGEIVALRLLACDPELSKPVAEYPPSRPSPVAPDDHYLMAELASASALATVAALASALSAQALALGLWRFRVSLSAADLA